MGGQPKNREQLEAEIAALRRRIIELEAHNKDMDAFIQAVAHDLRNPLALVSGLGDTLYESHDQLSQADMQHYLRIVARNSHRMNNIIREQLVLASIGKQEEDKEPLDMARILADVQEGLIHLIKEHNAEIIVPKSWPLALGHIMWIEEVWSNYLSNAIRYGGRPPRVELSAHKQSDNMVRFSAHDNGPGLTPEEQADVFTPPEQPQRKRVKGYGLGLPVVRRIVERLGGQVGVESKGVSGQGCVFFFALPGIE